MKKTIVLLAAAALIFAFTHTAQSTVTTANGVVAVAGDSTTCKKQKKECKKECTKKDKKKCKKECNKPCDKK